MGHVKHNSAFEHALKVRIHIIQHMRSLIEASALHWNIFKYLMLPLEDSECPDQTARMRRLIWAFVVRIWPKTRFRIALLTVRMPSQMIRLRVHVWFRIIQNPVSLEYSAKQYSNQELLVISAY